MLKIAVTKVVNSNRDFRRKKTSKYKAQRKRVQTRTFKKIFLHLPSLEKKAFFGGFSAMDLQISNNVSCFRRKIIQS